MRWEVQVTTKTKNLYVRTGPSKSYKIVGRKAPGSKFIVNDRKVNGGWEWLKHEDTGYWSCKRDVGYSYDFLKITKDLDPPKPPEPVKEPAPVPVPEPEPKPLAIKGNGISEGSLDTDIFGSAGDTDWHKRVLTLEEEQSEKIYESSITNSEYSKANSLSNASKYKSILEDDQKNSYKTSYNSSKVVIAKSSSYTAAKLNADMKKIYYNLDMSYGGGGFYNGLMPQLFHNFNRYGIEFSDKVLPKSFPHVFFTRPDLNVIKEDGSLTSQAKTDELYSYIWNNNRDVIKSLTQFYTQNHQFNTFVHNYAKSFEISDEFIKPTEHGETLTGNKIQYGKSDIESRSAGDFSITYVDDANLNVYKMHKLWVDYISKVYRGHFFPRDNYKFGKTIDYACAAYYILCGPDGETILFWSKYYGVFPTNIPSSTLSWSKGSLVSNPEMSINYSYSFKEDFDPISLAEFNELCATKASKSKSRKNYDSEHASMGSTLVGAPYIDAVTVDGRKVFKLKWRDKKIKE